MLKPSLQTIWRSQGALPPKQWGSNPRPPPATAAHPPYLPASPTPCPRICAGTHRTPPTHLRHLRHHLGPRLGGRQPGGGDALGGAQRSLNELNTALQDDVMRGWVWEGEGQWVGVGGRGTVGGSQQGAGWGIRWGGQGVRGESAG
jgi:hypothetical protein